MDSMQPLVSIVTAPFYSINTKDGLFSYRKTMILKIQNDGQKLKVKDFLLKSPGF